MSSGSTVSKIGYHVTAIAGANLIELVRTEPVRGALEAEEEDSMDRSK